jgi:hypothetical protein
LPAAPCRLSRNQRKLSNCRRGKPCGITPEGKVDVFAKMQGDPAHIREMEKRGQPITKGLAIWVGNDGKLRFLTDPVEDAEHMRR